MVPPSLRASPPPHPGALQRDAAVPADAAAWARCPRAAALGVSLSGAAAGRGRQGAARERGRRAPRRGALRAGAVRREGPRFSRFPF